MAINSLINNDLIEALSYIMKVPNKDGLKSCLLNSIPLAEDFKIDAVYGAAYNIKDYYMESGNPRQMRGASQLLNDIFEIHIKKYLREKHTECCQCYQGGSQTLILLPSGCGDKMATYIEQLFIDYCITAKGVAVCKQTSVNELIDEHKFDVFLKKLFLATNARRMYKYDSRPENLLNGKTDELLFEFKSITHKNCYVHEKAASINRCQRCRLRTPTYIAELREEPQFEMCTSCAHKEIRGSYYQRIDFRSRCVEFCDEHGDLFGNVKLVLKKDNKGIINTKNDKEINTKKFVNDDFIDSDIRTTDDLKDGNGDIALLYADVNNLGGVGNSLHGIHNHIAFFKAVAKTVEHALFHALILSMKIEPGLNADGNLLAQFEIIAMGGDDICVLLPGNVALFAATNFACFFAEYWKDYSKPLLSMLDNANKTPDTKKLQEIQDLVDLSISVGVSVGRYTTPLAFMHTATESLLKSAKDRAHREKSSGKPPYGAIDILSLKSDAQWATELSFLRKKKIEKSLFSTKNTDTTSADMTMRPYTPEEAKCFLDIIDIAHMLSPNMLHNIENASKTLGIEEGDLFFEYLLSKAEPDSLFELKNLCSKLKKMLQNQLGNNIASSMYFCDHKKSYKKISPWHDIIDLWDQRKDAPHE